MTRAATERSIKIDVRDFSFYYGDFLALDGLTLGIGQNEITALIGPSGCGKSTFLRALNRMNDTIPGARPVGDIRLDGKNIYDPEVDVTELRQRVGMVFQRPNPFPQSIYDNVAFGPRVLGTARRSDLGDVVRQSLAGAGLWDEVKHRLHDSALNLNPGQQQRLCIARTIAVKPDVILMDEPCSALDPISTLRIEELMQELSAEYTIILVTHNMQQASRTSDMTAFFLSDEHRTGHLIEYGPTTEMFTRPKDKRTEDYISGRFG